jgi:hypothetical protein
MKYSVSKENVEFEVEKGDLPRLLAEIVRQVVPSEIAMIYFASESNALNGIEISGLRPINSVSNNETFRRKPRALYKDGRLTFVPVVKGQLSETKWKNHCRAISKRFHAYA